MIWDLSKAKIFDENTINSLYVLKGIGNNAVHDSNIDLKEDFETARKLFELVDIFAERMLLHPKLNNELLQKLIKKRDSDYDR